MKINVKGLKFQNWMYLMIFSVIILVVLWALQFLLLGSFYQNIKLHETESIGDQLADKFDDTDFYTLMNDYAFKNNLRIVLLDEMGRMAGHYDGFSAEVPGFRIPGGWRIFPQEDLRTVIRKFAETESDRVIYINTNEWSAVSQVVYAAKVHDTSGSLYYLYISNPMPAIDSTISALRTQFVIITAILFILSIIVAQLISKKMSKPIIQLTKSAEKLVKGELDTTFYDNGFTEIHQLAATLNYATGELRSLDNYRREFIANVSHDLKTPLTIIKFYGEMIKDVSGDNPEKRNKHCDIIIKEVDWLTGMVGEILELSKLEAGNEEASMKELNISRCLIDTLASFEVLADKDGYVFEIDIAEDLYVLGNEPMLRRVFYNLISNAVNFTGEDKRVIISLKSYDKKIHFKVSDTGEGIPKEKLNSIWDRYYKSNETHKRAVIGTGLGLSIVKNVLALHNAEYGVVSEMGKGSTFWFLLKDISNN